MIGSSISGFLSSRISWNNATIQLFSGMQGRRSWRLQGKKAIEDATDYMFTTYYDIYDLVSEPQPYLGHTTQQPTGFSF